MVHTNSPPAKPLVLLIMGSVRKGRLCPKVSGWVADIGQTTIDADFEIIDLRDWRLPLDDEPGVPAAGHYANAHTLAWSEKVSACQAVVFVSPQYNWGYPAPLKNALDHLYREWRHKPAMIVTYGGHGGDKCAQQLRQIATALHMRLVVTMPALTLSRSLIEANDGSLRPEQDFAGHLPDVRRAFSELAAELNGHAAPG